jgi:digeranylgeranylglycerophospholipid reductase
LVPAVQARVRLLQPLDVTEVYLHPDYHAGYAWLFPKEGMANAGVGFAPVPGGPRPTVALAAFLATLERRGRIAGPVAAYQAGWIPVAPLADSVRGNLLLVGDAAGQTHPVTGAGIFNAVTCGAMAGRWAARAALGDDVSLLRRYDEEWRDLLGGTLARAAARRRRMEAHWGRFDDIIRSCWVAFEEYHRPTLPPRAEEGQDEGAGGRHA